MVVGSKTHSTDTQSKTIANETVAYHFTCTARYIVDLLKLKYDFIRIYEKLFLYKIVFCSPFYSLQSRFNLVY